MVSIRKKDRRGMERLLFALIQGHERFDFSACIRDSSDEVIRGPAEQDDTITIHPYSTKLRRVANRLNGATRDVEFFQFPVSKENHVLTIRIPNTSVDVVRSVQSLSSFRCNRPNPEGTNAIRCRSIHDTLAIGRYRQRVRPIRQ